MEGFDDQRKRLAEYLSGFAISKPEIKKAFLEVKRENFVPKRFEQYSYSDDALPNELGQTISQPSTIAMMLEILELKEGMKVLEVGSGSGYVLALMSRIVGKDGRVYGVELFKQLVEKSGENLEKEGIANIEVKEGDGAGGWKEKAPFDRILVSCACPFIPRELFNQLKEGGMVVAPVGDTGTQVMEMLVKKKGKPFKKTFTESLFKFVPLLGKHGFR